MTASQQLLHLNIADYVILGVVIVSTFISLIRGFIKEMMSLIVWVVAFVAAMRFCHNLASIFAPYIKSPSLQVIASFIVIVLVVLIFGAILNSLLSMLISKTGLSGLDRTLGMLFGCARGVLLIAVVLLLISTTAFVQDEWWKQSILIPHFQVLMDWLRIFLPQKFNSLNQANLLS
jgi:membrane protein required for colicin V production